MLHFHLLGELQVVEDGMPSLYRLLVRTACWPPYSCIPACSPALNLCGLLFPDTSEHTSHKRLSDLVWLLRHALPALQLEATSQHIALPAEARWLDVEHFQEAATGTGGLSKLDERPLSLPR
jgi:DNA-binding SARP family transcriptional activator